MMHARRFLATLAPGMAGLAVLLTAQTMPAVPIPNDVSPAGTIEGRFIFDGVLPVLKALDMEKDETRHCKKGPESARTDPTWIVGAEGGVANVVVWVRAPRDAAFKLAAKDKVRKEPVVIRQAYCAFEPHVFVLYPSYFDAETGQQKKTGQILKVINDAPIPHNANVALGNPKLNAGSNELLPPQTPDRTAAMKFENIRPCPDRRSGGEETIRITCNVHPWMHACGWVFDHPFFAITQGGVKADKAFGTFKIQNVPVEMELDLVYWHETMPAPKVIQKVTLDRGKGRKIPDMKIK